MKPELKKRVRQFGIPLDLVILATGVGLLLPISIPTLLVIFIAAVALSAWKLGWQSGLVATGSGLLALIGAFGDEVHSVHALSFIALGLVATAAMSAIRKPRAASAVQDVHIEPIAFVPSPAALVAEVAPVSDEMAKQLELERLESERLIAREREEAERAAAKAEQEKEELARRLDEELRALERATAERAEKDRRERERVEREKEELERRLTSEREAAERAAAQSVEEERLRAEREKKEREQRLAAEREAVDRAAAQRAEEQRAERERVEREKVELARRTQAEKEELERRLAAEREAIQRAADERAQHERRERERAEQEREQLAKELAELTAERNAREQLEREKAELTAQLERARQNSELVAAGQTDAAKRDTEKAIEQRLARERAEMQKKFDEQLRTEKEALEKKIRATPAAGNEKPSSAREDGGGLLSTISGWFKTSREPRPAVNLKTKRIASNKPPAPAKSILPAPPPPRAGAQPQAPRERRPRVLMLERRRGMADTVAPRLRELGLDVQVVERWIDAVDELFRFRPDAMFIDVDLPDFQKVHRSVTDQAPKLPIVLSAQNHASLPVNVGRAASITRPFSADAIAKIARDAVANPQQLLERQGKPVAASSQPAPSGPPQRKKAPIAAVEPLIDGPTPLVPTPAAEASERYDVVCFNCRVGFDATDADWCSCLTKERTLVCTNCLTCFCKAPPAYKEKFWVQAPPRLFERKSAELRKQQTAVGSNPPPDEAKRPLVLLVEDDEDIQMIVQRVCSNLGYGFVTANNGQDGLTVARAYRPNLILSDAFMPKLDGREMCRILKEEAIIPDCKMIVMTGLYTDTKYKSEALKRFHIDDYLSKPVSITDLINLLQKHLEGVASASPQEDLFEIHRQQVEDDEAQQDAGGEQVDERDDPQSIALADLLNEEPNAGRDRMTARREARSASPTYDICCFTCNEVFDANQAEWCTCLGRDQTLVCPQCSNCFCKAPAAYKERFWIDAPSSLFERKMIGSKRNVTGKNNPSPMEVKRPLILLVEDDENIQLIVKTVVTTMGYGFIVAANGQEGLALAREYNPDLILSDAFMPKLDGREMCRLLKEDPATARMKAIIMTGLYTDRKYRNEALTYFKVDDYVAKPVAVDDLIKLMKKHLPQDVQPTM
jgi:CheY-like chemotaxis protein